ncbi:MAG: hypothetical protein IKS90_07460 [Clostridia bacterium]|nr:hypothetical protein [Clostridia bacterium]
MIKLHISAQMPCAVGIFSDASCLFGTDKSVFELDADGSILVKISPIVCAGEYVPAETGVRLDIKIENGIKTLLLDSTYRDNAELIDWGFDLYELEPRFLFYRSRPLPPQTLDEAEFVSNGNRCELTLFTDNGLLLETRSCGAERTYSLGAGQGGTLRTLDTGKAVILIVECETVCEDKTMLPRPEKMKRVLIINENFETVGEIRSSNCRFEDGYLISIEPLGTVLGHEARRMYELTENGAAELSDEAEVGFFSHEKTTPKDGVETAVAFLECLLLGREDECLSLISQGLANRTDYDTICEFFGDFDRCKKTPFCSQNGAVTVGTVSDETARAYVFDVENGLIRDVSEYAPEAQFQSE